MCDLFECVFCEFEDTPFESQCFDCNYRKNADCVDCDFYGSLDCPEWGD